MPYDQISLCDIDFLHLGSHLNVLLNTFWFIELCNLSVIYWFVLQSVFIVIKMLQLCLNCACISLNVAYIRRMSIFGMNSLYNFWFVRQYRGKFLTAVGVTEADTSQNRFPLESKSPESASKPTKCASSCLNDSKPQKYRLMPNYWRFYISFDHKNLIENKNA